MKKERLNYVAPVAMVCRVVLEAAVGATTSSYMIDIAGSSIEVVDYEPAPEELTEDLHLFIY